VGGGDHARPSRPIIGDGGVTGTIRGTWAINGKTITLKITSAEDERVNNSVTSSTILAFNQDELSMKSDRGETQHSLE
jgi:hypothetical protein